MVRKERLWDIGITEGKCKWMVERRNAGNLISTKIILESPGVF